jgi:uncharacterized Zn finger protein
MWWRYESPRPKKEVKGGIKAQSKRGDFGVTWWGRRWMTAIESFTDSGRLQRGRSYARGGQTLNINVQPGKITAQVQGSDPKPYNITIEMKQLTEPQWDSVITAMTSQAAFAAKLLAGDFPEEVATIFTDQKLSLFPGHRNDLKTKCSCPDSSNPCKHIAAVFYLLAETFDADPFLLFRLRGKDKPAFFARFQCVETTPSETTSEEEKPKKGKAKTKSKKTKSVAEAPEVKVEAKPIPVAPPSDPAEFWKVPSLATSPVIETAKGEAAAAVKGLGAVPMWRGETPFLDAMTAIYKAARETGAVDS